jgi:hypothetical protein
VSLLINLLYLLSLSINQAFVLSLLINCRCVLSLSITINRTFLFSLLIDGIPLSIDRSFSQSIWSTESLYQPISLFIDWLNVYVVFSDRSLCFCQSIRMFLLFLLTVTCYIRALIVSFSRSRFVSVLKLHVPKWLADCQLMRVRESNSMGNALCSPTLQSSQCLGP